MSSIRTEVENHVALVTLDNAPVNAAALDMLQELTDVFDSFNDRDDVRVAVLTGAGKCFSAGADLKNRPDLSIPGKRWNRNRIVREVAYSIADCAKPVIAAVNGPALGAGFGLAASCDIIVASENAVFGLPEIDVGLMGGGKHTSRIVPHSLTRPGVRNVSPRHHRGVPARGRVAALLPGHGGGHRVEKPACDPLCQG